IDTGALIGEPTAPPAPPIAPVAARRRKAFVLGADTATVTLVQLGTAITAARAEGIAERPSSLVAVVTVPFWLIALHHYRLYSSQSVYRRPEELGRVIHASMAASFASTFVAFMLGVDVPRAWPLLAFTLGVVAL